jgi:hypothetical protein
VLDGVAARPEEGVDAVGPMRMGGDTAAHHVRRLDDGPELRVRELLPEAGARVRQHAAGGRDLDQVGAHPNLLAHRAAAVVGARADARRAQHAGDVLREAVHVRMTAMRRHG